MGDGEADQENPRDGRSVPNPPAARGLDDPDAKRLGPARVEENRPLHEHVPHLVVTDGTEHGHPILKHVALPHLLDVGPLGPVPGFIGEKRED